MTADLCPICGATKRCTAIPGRACLACRRTLRRVLRRMAGQLHSDHLDGHDARRRTLRCGVRGGRS